MIKKIPRIIFIISFLPYLLVFIWGVISAFSGLSFLFDRIYGFEAFILSFFYTAYSWIFRIPIIPICFIFQICYVFRAKIEKLKNIKFGKYFMICLTIGCCLILSLLLYSYSFEISYEIENFFEKISAKQMINKAEEKIGFNKHTVVLDGIFDMPEYKYNHIFIDYDNVEIGMLLYSSFDEFWKVKLQKTTKGSSVYKHIVNDYFMQADILLDYPGARLISFYEDDSLMHHTIAFLLIYEDGTIYFADNVKDEDTGFTRFTGLHWSEFFVGENVKFRE